jgi:hypothetical protein
MPIGASKLGVLGAGLVPGGSVTFNSSGDWTIPPGVKKVSITGRGGTGNPGNAGNPGNPGNPGTGGGGGSGNNQTNCNAQDQTNGPVGGAAYKRMITQSPQPGTSFVVNPGVPLNPPSNSCCWAKGGNNLCGNRNPGQSGSSGNAGNQGNAGNPGNTGQNSSGLGNTFPGGAGGNAGVAGAAGNGGSGGNGGAKSQPYVQGQPGQGGAGGNGGGNGGRGALPTPQRNCCWPALPNVPAPNVFRHAGKGGGGAGIVNSGQDGLAGIWYAPPRGPTALYTSLAYGGSGGGVNAIAQLCPCGPNPAPVPTDTMGGVGFRDSNGGRSIILNVGVSPNSPNNLRRFTSQFNPSNTNCSTFQQIFRAGGGGGGGGNPVPGASCFPGISGSGGGGGGRGNAGNAGGGSPTPTGVAANPVTFNCVPVTPGATTPIVVGSPGGTVTISWNPQ